MSSRSQAGFTLIEVIGAFFMMTIILIFVTGIFVENGRQRSAATELMRVHTTSAAALDLIAQDLEGALFVARPENKTARDHAWRFAAEQSGEFGATFLRFQTQNVSRANLAEHASTWVEVVYFLTEDEPERFTLWRWRSARPPYDPSRPDPDEDDSASARIAEGVSNFGVVFADALGATNDEWDSAFRPPDSPLPASAEIRLALYREARAGEAEGDEIEVPGREHVRHVSLPMTRPIDVDALIKLALAGETGADCSTLTQCVELEPGWYEQEVSANCNGAGDQDLCDDLQAAGTLCWEDFEQDWPTIAEQASPDCESLP